MKLLLKSDQLPSFNGVNWKVGDKGTGKVHKFAVHALVICLVVKGDDKLLDFCCARKRSSERYMDDPVIFYAGQVD